MNPKNIYLNKHSESLESDQFFLQVVQTLSTDLLFRHDLKTNTMYYFGSAREELGLPEVIYDYPHSLKNNVAFHPEDFSIVLEQIEQMYKGNEVSSDFRFYDAQGKAIWHRKEYRLCYDEDGVPAEAIGRSCNIQEKKEMETQVNFDALTGCYRKGIFERLAEQHLQQYRDIEHTLIIVDLDNFKAINDNLGHQFGDVVLREVGDTLKSIFRSSDLVGRIGGDEFMIFMKNTCDAKTIVTKVSQILEQLDKTYQGAHHSYHISASIGVAAYPLNGDNFQELYDNADIAMFDAKNRGKNDFVFYTPTLSKGTMENTLPFDVAARALSQHFDHKIVAKVFSLLFESQDLEFSMASALAAIGRRFGVSRAYVFESSPNGTDCYDNTFEWCAENILEELPNLQGLTFDQFEPLFSRANDEGIIYCNDFDSLGDDAAKEILEAQDIKSFLHAYIRSGEKFSYVIGFDDCVHHRVWSPIEITTLLYVSKIMAQFANYNKTIKAAETSSQERLSVLDSFNYPAYIIDIHSYEITYLNKNTKAKFPNVKLGDLCYKMLRGRDQECFNCPLKTMRQDHSPSARTVIYNEILDKNMLVNASRLTSFDGKESLFVSINEMPKKAACGCEIKAELENVNLHNL